MTLSRCTKRTPRLTSARARFSASVPVTDFTARANLTYVGGGLVATINSTAINGSPSFLFQDTTDIKFYGTGTVYLVAVTDQPNYTSPGVSGNTMLLTSQENDVYAPGTSTPSTLLSFANRHRDHSLQGGSETADDLSATFVRGATYDLPQPSLTHSHWLRCPHSDNLRSRPLPWHRSPSPRRWRSPASARWA